MAETHLERARWIGLAWPDEHERPAVLLRRAFDLDEDVQGAVLEVTALGVYRLLLDGVDVSPGRLGPGWTDYRRRVRVQRVELGRLGAGRHVIGIELGEGWWSGHVGYHRVRRVYGDRPWARASLAGTVAGSAWELVTDATWEAALGEVRRSDLHDGEHVDLRLARPDWSRSGCGGEGWQPVEVGAPAHGRLVVDRGPPIRVVANEPAVSVTEPLPGVQIVDVGRNLAGHARIRLQGASGREVALRHGEWLEEDGTLYRANLREARQTDRVVLAGGETWWEPRFTTHGFRYVEVTGAQPLRPADVSAQVVRTDLQRVGWFACSDDRVNRLHQLLTWSIESNSIGLPTDCPQRDERLGWLEDVRALLPTRCFLYDHRTFLARWLDDVRDAQGDDGWFPDVAPLAGSDRNPLVEGAPGWADAGVQVPWELWRWYGDESLVHENLGAAARFVRAVADANPDGRWRSRRGADYGDWLGFLPADPDLVAQAQAARTAHALVGMTRVAGDRELEAWAANWRDRVVAAFRADHVDAAGHVGDRSASACTLALAFDLLAPAGRDVAAQDLIDHVRRHENAVTVGYLALPHLLPVLSAAGRDDVAWDLLLGERMPGWMHLLASGATSLWERWDGWTPETGLHQAWLNSLNHASLGVVGDWLHACVGGLAPAAPGWDRVRIDPRPGGGVTWAQARHVTAHGEVAVEWEATPAELHVRASVPAGVTAVIGAGAGARTFEGPGEVTDRRPRSA